MIVTTNATVWVCDHCGSYYASSSVGDLREEWNLDKKGQRTFPRSQCPSHGCAVQLIQRRPVNIEIELALP